MSYVETTVQQYLRAQLSLDKKYGPYINITSRDAIPTEDRYQTMMVGVIDNGTGLNAIYQLNGGITNADWELVGTGGETVYAKQKLWNWSDGVDFNGTHLDFIVDEAIEDNEIGSLESSIFFVGGSLQVSTITLESTNFANDTIRVEGTIGERESDVEVALFYNRNGLGSSGGVGPGNNVVLLNEYYVSKTGVDSNNGSLGAPFLTIQAAIDVAPSGERSNIYIDEGIYTDNVVVDKPIQLIGIKGSGRFDVLTEITGQLTTSVVGIIFRNLKLPSVSPNITTYDIVIDCNIASGTMRGKYYNCLMLSNISTFTDDDSEWNNCIFEGSFTLSRGKVYNSIINGSLTHNGANDLSLYNTIVKGNFIQNGSTLNLYGSHIEGSISGSAVNIINHDKASEVLFDDTIAQTGAYDLQNAVTQNSINIGSIGGELSAHTTGDGTDHTNVVLNDTHRTGDGSDHSAVAINSSKRTYPVTDQDKLVLIEDGAQVHIPPIHTNDYASLIDAASKQDQQIIGHPYKTLDDENYWYLRAKTGGISDYDGGGVIEEAHTLVCSGVDDSPVIGWVNQKIARFDYTLQAIYAEVKTAPSGGDCVADIKINGVTTATITISDGSINQSVSPPITNIAWNKNDILGIEIISANNAVYLQIDMITTRK